MLTLGKEVGAVGLGVVMVLVLVGIPVAYMLVVKRFLVRKLPDKITNLSGRRLAKAVGVIVLLWPTLIEPVIGYVVFRTHAALHAGPVVTKTVDNVDSVLFKDNPGKYFWLYVHFNKLQYNHLELEENGVVRLLQNRDHWYNDPVLEVSQAQYVVDSQPLVRSRYYSTATILVSTKAGEELARCTYVIHREPWGILAFATTAALFVIGNSGSHDPAQLYPQNYPVQQFVLSVLHPRS